MVLFCSSGKKTKHQPHRKQSKLMMMWFSIICCHIQTCSFGVYIWKAHWSGFSKSICHVNFLVYICWALHNTPQHGQQMGKLSQAKHGTKLSSLCTALLFPLCVLSPSASQPEHTSLPLSLFSSMHLSIWSTESVSPFPLLHPNCLYLSPWQPAQQT